MINSFSLTFLFALSLMVALRVWLAVRQIEHVRRHRPAVPTQFAGFIDLAAHQKAADYSVTRTRLGFVSLAVEIMVLLAFTFGGGLQALHEFWSQQLSGLGYGIALIFSVAFISGAIDLPLSLYSQFVVEQRFGFNRMTLRLFFLDLLKQTLLGVAIGIPVLLAILWLMAQMGNLWWLYVWLFWCGFNLLILFIYPTWIAPLFNKFSPLDDAPLKARIEALLQRCGFALSGLFVMDGSKRSSHGNAYFTGFGKSKRIVFFDTLLSRLQPAEIEAVLAHELGHYKRRHVIKRIVLMFALSLVGFALLGWLSSQVWFYTGLGVMPSMDGSNSALALLLFMMVMPLFTYFLSPLMAQLSRKHEFEADAYAKAQTSADDLASALLKLYQDNASTLTPDPLYVRFYYSHPDASERLTRLRAA